MKGKHNYKERYPGLLPFDKVQAPIFFGRDKETKELHYLVSLEKVVVLFGRSGLGKSSLINAGLSPLLEKNNYLPVKFRFNPGTTTSNSEKKENPLIRDFLIAIQAYQHTKNIVYNADAPRIWEFVKATRFDNKEGRPMTPVFIFDQFEEFFNHPVHHQQEFLEQLAEIIHNDPPHRILEWVTSIDIENRTAIQTQWATQPDLKIIFSLRSDRLAGMQFLTNYISTVLRNRYELRPLTRSQAKEAIEKPAASDKLGADYTPPFSFEPVTLDNIVNELSKGSDEIESSQLQIICNYIEKRVRTEQDKNGEAEKVEVNDRLIDPAQDFPDVLDNFYEEQLLLIEDTVSREKARSIIEDELVINGYRDSISQRKMMNTLGVKKELIDALVNTRLVREETTNKGLSYEVSHDTLVASIEKSKLRRKEAEEKSNQLIEQERLKREAEQKDAELKERLRQLEQEREQKEEAIRQREQIQALGKKLRRRTIIIGVTITLALAAAVALVIILKGDNSYLARKRNEIEKEYMNKLYEDAIKKQDTTITTSISETQQKTASLKIIDKLDSLATESDQDTTRVVKLIDSVFKDDFKQGRIDPKKLDRKEKLKYLKMKY